MRTLGRTLLCAGLLCLAPWTICHAQQVTVTSDAAVGVAVAGPQGFTHVSGNGVAVTLDGHGLSGVVAGPAGVWPLRSPTIPTNPFGNPALPSGEPVAPRADPGLRLDLGTLQMSLPQGGAPGLAIDLGNGSISLPQIAGMSIPGIRVGPAGAQVQTRDVSIDTRQGFDVAVGQGHSQIRVSQTALEALASARKAFHASDYPLALRYCDQAAQTMAWNPDVQQMSSLVCFALEDHRPAAAAAYEALSRGDAWDWATLSGLYADPASYTAQYRALQQQSREADATAEVHFLMAYHYLVLGHSEAARAQLEQMLELQPGDRLASQLLARMAAESQATPPGVE